MEWKEVRLGDVCESIYSGGTPSTSTKEYWNGNLPWLSSGETGQKYIFKTEKYITELGAKQSSTRFAYKGSTVVASAGQGYTRGQASYLEIDTYVNQSVIVLKPNLALIDSMYLYFNISNRYSELRQLSDGTSTRGSLSGRIMKDINIKIPSLEIQRRIANILSSLDRKIELNNKINAQLEEMAQTLFKHWFVDFGPFKDGKFVESVLGMIPEGWRVGTLGEITQNVTDGVHNTVQDDNDSPFLLLSAKNIKDGRLIIGDRERHIGKETFEKLRKRTRLSKYDILITTVGTIGELMLLFETPDYIEFQRSVGIIKPESKEFSFYLYILLKTQITKVKNLAHGAVQQCIFIGDLKEYQFLVPKECCLKEFASKVENLFEKISKNNQENQNLASLRDTLLPKLMSGEITL